MRLTRAPPSGLRAGRSATPSARSSSAFGHAGPEPRTSEKRWNCDEPRLGLSSIVVNGTTHDEQTVGPTGVGRLDRQVADRFAGGELALAARDEDEGVRLGRTD